QLLGVEVEQLAGPRMLVALRHRRRLEPPATGQSRPPQNPRRGGGTHAHGAGDLGARPTLEPQDFDAERDGGGGLARARMRPTGAILQSAGAFDTVAAPTPANSTQRHVEPARDRSRQFAAL